MTGKEWSIKRASKRCDVGVCAPLLASAIDDITCQDPCAVDQLLQYIHGKLLTTHLRINTTSRSRQLTS